MKTLARAVAAGALLRVGLSLLDRWVHRKLCEVAGAHVP